MRIIKKNINGITHIGLIIKLFDDFILASNSVEDKYLREFDMKIEKVNSELIGPFILEYEDKVILSENCPKELIEVIKKYKDIILINTKENLLGNLFTIGKNGILYSKALKKDVELLVKITNLPAYRIKVPYLISTLIKVYDNKALVSQTLPDKILDKIRGILNVKRFNIGSVNFGSPYLKYGIEVNKNYLIVGDLTTGHELVKIEETFRS